jgi:hypothetical protein
MSGLNKSQGQLVLADGSAKQSTDADLGLSGKTVKGHINSSGGVSALGKAATHLIGCDSAGGGVVVVPGVAGTTVYQAENYVGPGCTATTGNQNHVGWRGTGFCDFPTRNGVLAFTGIDGGTGGDATMTVRYACTRNRTADLSVNGSSDTIRCTRTGGDWKTWGTISVTIKLKPGKSNTITITSSGQDWGNTDEITIVAP